MLRYEPGPTPVLATLCRMRYLSSVRERCESYFRAWVESVVADLRNSKKLDATRRLGHCFVFNVAIEFRHIILIAARPVL